MYDLSEVREHFPILNEVIYLDNAATTQTPLSAIKAMEDYFLTYAANHGRGAHRLARKTTDKYEDTRENIASFLNSNVEGTIFTRNATESINIIAHGIKWEKKDHIITSVAEHHSNFLPWIKLREIGVNVTVLPTSNEGIIDPYEIEKSITDSTKLIAINHVTNTFGSIQDIEAIIKIGHKNGCEVLIDASQSAGHMPLDVKKIAADYFVAPGHKGLLGPQGTGLLIIKNPDTINPLNLGGGMVHTVSKNCYEIEKSPNKFEAGTPNIPGVIGFGKAVEFVKEIGIKNIERYENKLSHTTADLLGEIPHVNVYGPKKRAGLVSFNIDTLNPHDVAIILDQTKKICVRSGFHCAMPAMKHIGLNGTVRVSFALYNQIEEVNIFIESVKNITKLIES